MTTDLSKKTQCEKIAQRLREVGYVDNFWAVDNKISYRLAARLYDLRKDGWEFRTEKLGTNYRYHLVLEPRKVPRQLVLGMANA